MNPTTVGRSVIAFKTVDGKLQSPRADVVAYKRDVLDGEKAVRLLGDIGRRGDDGADPKTGYETGLDEN